MSRQSLNIPNRVCGFYGKIPAVGDFVSRGLTTEMVSRLDVWLAEYVSSLPSLLPNYDTYWQDAPIWRFVAATGIFSSQICIGLLTNSYDAVGRMFPLVILYELSSEKELEHIFLNDNNSTWLHDVEDVIYATRHQCLDSDKLLKVINRLNPLDNELCESDLNTISSIWLKCLKLIQSQGSLWWYEGKNSTTYCEYTKLPRCADFVKYYGLV